MPPLICKDSGLHLLLAFNVLLPDVLTYVHYTQAYDIQRDTTALKFAEQALRKGSNHFQQIPDPPAFARPALEDPATSASDKLAGPKSVKSVQAPTRVPRLTSTGFFQPRLTSGWAPKVACSYHLVAGLRLPHHLTQVLRQEARLTLSFAMLQVDAIETDSHYQLEVALPGIRKGELGKLWPYALLFLRILLHNLNYPARTLRACMSEVLLRQGILQ